MADESQVPQQEAPQEPVAPETPPKMTVQEASEKLAKGEIDVSNVSLDEFMANVNEDASEPEVPEVVPQAETPAAPPTEPQPERPRYKTIGELFSKAKEETGESFQDAHGIIEKVKRQKTELVSKDTALSRWKSDAVTNKARADALAKELEAAKAIADAAKVAPPPVAEKPQEEELYDEPEIEPPDELAEVADVIKYNQKVVQRMQRINQKRQENLEKQFKAELAKRDETIAAREASAAAAAKAELEKRLEADKKARYQGETMKAASDFVKSHTEFDFGDNTSVQEKNAQYSQLLNDVRYIKEKMPHLNQRDLVGDYLQGIPDAVSVLTEHGVTVPQGLRPFKILLDLEGIAQQHNLTVPETGAPDFKAAYAIKKAREGADVDELNQALMHGVEMVTEVANARQAAPPSVSAQEAGGTEPPKQADIQQLMQQLTDLQTKQASMTPDEYKKADEYIRSEMARNGLVVADHN